MQKVFISIKSTRLDYLPKIIIDILKIILYYTEMAVNNCMFYFDRVDGERRTDCRTSS